MIQKNEQKRLPRYEAEKEIRFDFAYDVETKMKFKVSENALEHRNKNKYLAMSRNFSTEGLCFVSGKKLEKGSRLDLEIYLPGDDHEIHLEGEVKWCAFTKGIDAAKSENQQFDTGVKLVMVEGRSVEESVHFDETYQVEWSSVLELVLGKYRIMMQKKKNPEEGKVR